MRNPSKSHKFLVFVIHMMVVCDFDLRDDLKVAAFRDTSVSLCSRFLSTKTLRYSQYVHLGFIFSVPCKLVSFQDALKTKRVESGNYTGKLQPRIYAAYSLGEHLDFTCSCFAES